MIDNLIIDQAVKLKFRVKQFLPNLEKYILPWSNDIIFLIVLIFSIQINELQLP